MRVAVGRAAVRGPPGVPDAVVAAGNGALGQHLLEVGELAGLLRRRSATVGEDGDACGVVAPVLQPAEAFQDHVPGVLRTDISHDAAHWTESTGPGSVTLAGDTDG